MPLFHNEFQFLVTDIKMIIKRQTTLEWKIHYANRTHHTLALCIQGTGSYEFNGCLYQVGKGDVLFFPKNMFHSGASQAEDPLCLYIAQFDAEFAGPLSEEQFYQLHNIIGSSVFAQFLALFEELHVAYSVKTSGYRLKCASRIMDIFHLLIREVEFAGNDRSYSPKIETVLKWMAENSSASCSVEELSRMVELSPSRLRRLFKQLTGLSVKDYHIRTRLDQARDLLISGCSVTEAALETGFADIYYFSRLFKKKTGLSPTEYVRAYRKLH